jgi:hypothetical protein
MGPRNWNITPPKPLRNQSRILNRVMIQMQGNHNRDREVRNS